MSNLIYYNCKQMQILSGNGEKDSMKVICGSYVIADGKGRLAFLRGRHVHTLSLGLSCLAHEYLEYGMHSGFSMGAGEKRRIA